MKRRRGYSLVEMIVVISAGTVLAGLAVTLLGALLHASGTINEEVRGIVAVRRLSEQFRDDAHAALRAEALPKDGASAVAGMRFELATGHTVAYELLPTVIERTERVDDAVRARESFFLPPGTIAAASLSTAAVAPVATEEQAKNSEPTLATLVIAPGSQADKSPELDADTAARAAHAAVRIEAVVAKDHRYHRLP
jgi:prepilin-type N-terminal cleavage/methylation domain-containing protein